VRLNKIIKAGSVMESNACVPDIFTV